MHLILRGQGGTGKDYCWLETGPSGQKDVDYPGTDHDWGWERSSSVDKTQTYDITKNVSETIEPLDVRMEIPCAKDTRSLVGMKEVENTNGWVERVSYDLHQSGEAETEVELVPADEYPEWMPQAGQDEKTIGNDIDVGIVAHAKGDPSLKPPKKVVKYTITLEGTSQEKGVDCNWPPSEDATTDYDMKIDPDNGWIKVADDKGQSAETKEEGLTEFRVTINSYDWGGYTKLKVVAELEDGQSVVAHVRGHSDQDSLSIPKDDNNNHIADTWEYQFNLKNTDASADDDGKPEGDGDNGDSIALYDEYRGFNVNGRHERFSPETKDLLVYDGLDLGAGVYPQATGVSVHLVQGRELIHKGGAKNIYVVTGNSHYGDVYALNLRPEALDDGLIGLALGGPGVPRDIIRVIVDTSKIARLLGDAAEPQKESTIAHELGHGTNIRHHGEMPPDYMVDNVRCTLKDGSTQQFPRVAGWTIATQGGSYSGNDQCLMRYTSASFYENANGVCWWTHDGTLRKGWGYGRGDSPGMTLCPSGVGTGVNDPSDPNNRAGNASPGRGNCIHKFCLKNSAH